MIEVLLFIVALVTAVILGMTIEIYFELRRGRKKQ